MHIISYRKIRLFIQKHPNAKSGLNHWHQIAKQSDFQTFMDVKALFPTADQTGNFVVFNIGGNHYRLIAFIRYRFRKIFIRDILTHDEYNKNKWKEDEWYRHTKK